MRRQSVPARRRRRSGRFTIQGSRVVQEDVQLCRGVVNVVDSVFGLPTSANRVPRREPETLEPECQSIYEIVESFEESFELLLDQISSVDEVKERLEGQEEFTFFAPVNDPATQSINEARPEDVRDDLERLIVSGDLAFADLVDGQALRSISVS